MIGGGMLACAVGAMILIAWWSLPRDDKVDPATGLLALKTWSDRVVSRKHNTPRRKDRRPEQPDAPAKRDRRPASSARRSRRR